jgi:RNA polymerase primary sigma factor
MALNIEEGPVTELDDDSEARQSVATMDDLAPSAEVGEPLPLYLREIGRVPLLSGADEVRLAKAFEEGRAAHERLATERESLSEEEIEQLEDVVHRGESARNVLTESNLRLVVSIARRYMNRGVALGDLIQEGNIGLMRAVEKFEWRRGFKFSTYATWWIRQAVTRAIADDGRTIRIPVHLVDLVNRIARVSGQLHQELGREPTDEEIAELVEVSAERVRELARVTPAPISLDSHVGDEQDTVLAEIMADDSAEVPEEVADHLLLRDRVRETLLTLSPREQQVIIRRYGLENGVDRTLTEIGREVGVTRERIRQIESTAMRKLRQPSRTKQLAAYAS